MYWKKQEWRTENPPPPLNALGKYNCRRNPSQHAIAIAVPPVQLLAAVATVQNTAFSFWTRVQIENIVWELIKSRLWFSVEPKKRGGRVMNASASAGRDIVLWAWDDIWTRDDAFLSQADLWYLWSFKSCLWDTLLRFVEFQGAWTWKRCCVRVCSICFGFCRLFLATCCEIIVLVTSTMLRDPIALCWFLR